MRTQLVPLCLGALATLGGCKAVQPKAQCKAQPTEYAARYFAGEFTGNCSPEQKELTGELLHMNYYAADRDKAGSVPKVAIEPAVVAEAIAEAEHGEVAEHVKWDPEEYSIGNFASVYPNDKDICVAKELTTTSVEIPEIPMNTMLDPPIPETIPARSYKFEWSNLNMLVKPTSNAIHFGADLVRTEGECVATYKVSAVFPVVGCEEMEDTKEIDPKTGELVVDDEGHVVQVGTGHPNPDACLYSTGSGADIVYSGLAPDISYECDEHTFLCMPTDEFPSKK